MKSVHIVDSLNAIFLIAFIQRELGIEAKFLGELRDPCESSIRAKLKMLSVLMYEKIHEKCLFFKREYGLKQKCLRNMHSERI